jgi:superfamily I DNA/RNA helicase
LTNPKLETDFILFDEAQDADPVIRSIIEQQKEHSKIVSVGDPHQQIYSWRGSQDAMHIMDGKKFYLTKTFRFGREIANLANAILRKLDEPKNIVDNGSAGNVEWGAPFNYENGGILCRTNKAAFRKYIGMYEKYDDVSLNINHDDIESFLNGAEKLMNGRRAYSPEMLSLFRTWGEVVDYANTGAGTDIAYIVDLIERLGVPTLKTALKLSRKKNAALTISTIHKAKGLEWDNVAIDQDFTFTRNKKKQIELDDEEKRLLYVACTRAKINLNVSEIAENLCEFIGWRLIRAKRV